MKPAAVAAWAAACFGAHKIFTEIAHTYCCLGIGAAQPLVKVIQLQLRPRPLPAFSGNFVGFAVEATFSTCASKKSCTLHNQITVRVEHVMFDAYKAQKQVKRIVAHRSSLKDVDQASERRPEMGEQLTAF